MEDDSGIFSTHSLIQSTSFTITWLSPLLPQSHDLEACISSQHVLIRSISILHDPLLCPSTCTSLQSTSPINLYSPIMDGEAE